MPFTQQNPFSFNHVDQIDTPLDDATTVKEFWDSRGNEVRTALNGLISALNATAASASVGFSPNANVDAEANTVQEAFDALVTLLHGTGGATWLKAVGVEGLTGDNVQALLESLKSYVDTNYASKNEITNNRKLSPTGDFSGTWNGVPMTSAEPGLSSAFNAHLVDNTYRLNVASMIADNDLAAGTKVITHGYSVIGDGGEGKYQVVGSLSHTPSDVDNGSIIALNNGLYAELFVDSCITPEQFGVYGVDTTDPIIISNNTLQLQKAINFCQNKGCTLTSSEGKVYTINAPLNFTNALNINFNKGTIKQTTANTAVNVSQPGTHNYMGNIRGIRIDCNSIATLGIFVTSAQKTMFSDIEIDNITGTGLEVDSGYELFFNNMHFKGNGINAIGITMKTSDCHFTDIIGIDLRRMIYLPVSTSNVWTRIHAWISTPDYLLNSTFMIIHGGVQFLESCFSDT